MRALTLRPGEAGSLRLDDVADPEPRDGSLLVQALALGICGTDHEMARGGYGSSPPDRQRLVLGHESLGRVLEAPAGRGFTAGDHVVGIVRRPDPVPCAACAAGEWDMCRNGRYTERGIKGRDGYASERWTVDPAYAIAVDGSLGLCGVLLEPTSIVAKAWEHVERIAARGVVELERVLVTGAGPIGLLAALLGRQRGLDVHVLDLVQEGPKPDAVRALGATYHAGALGDVPVADVVIECTGVPEVIAQALSHHGPAGIVCLTGVSSGGHRLRLDVGALNRQLVLENDVIFGSVNANRRHYEQAAAALLAAPREWLSRVISRRVPLREWEQAFEPRPGDIKVVLEFS